MPPGNSWTSFPHISSLEDAGSWIDPGKFWKLKIGYLKKSLNMK